MSKKAGKICRWLHLDTARERHGTAKPCGGEWHSAESQAASLRTLKHSTHRISPPPADCRSATQQTNCLRYRDSGRLRLLPLRAGLHLALGRLIGETVRPVF